MTKLSLVFHSQRRGSTAFGDAIDRVLDASEHVRIVSPYLGLAVLDPIAKGRSFQLITDLDACFEGNPDRGLVRFFERHIASVRNLPLVHAKVVLGERSALMGSANLTESGFCRRFEMSCLLFDTEHLAELRRWFDWLWQNAAELEPATLKRYVEQSRSRQTRLAAADLVKPKPRGKGAGGRLPVVWAQIPAAKSAEGVALGGDETDERKALSAKIRKFTGSRAEAERVLDLLAEVLRVAGLERDDPRLHLNYTDDVGVFIGQRAVAWCKKGLSCFILDDVDLAKKTARRFSGAYEIFTDRGRPDLPLLRVPMKDLSRLSAGVFESWHRGIRKQVEKASRGKMLSGFLRYKKPFLYDVLVDDALRESVLDLAFPA